MTNQLEAQLKASVNYRVGLEKAYAAGQQTAQEMPNVQPAKTPPPAHFWHHPGGIPAPILSGPQGPPPPPTAQYPEAQGQQGPVIGLQAKVSIEKKELSEAKVVEPYEIKLIYKDGSSQLKKILK
jgi:hypothetical protein